MKTNEIINLIQKFDTIVLNNAIVTKEQAQNFISDKEDNIYNCKEYGSYMEIYKIKKK